MEDNNNNYNNIEWNDLRGRALDKPTQTNLDLRKLELKLIYIVNCELEKFENKIKIDENNKYGKWISM
jgi:hypothetical protein